MKFAIFNYYGKSSNSGGPRGYLSNLYSGFEKLDIIPPDFVSKKLDDASTKKNMSHGRPSDLRCVLAFIKRGLIIRKEFKNIVRKYDVIHVHSTEECFFLRRFAGFKGKLILTSHCPEPLVNEKSGALKLSEKGHRLYKSLCNYVERKSYKYADAFIFPSKGAMGIYRDFPGFLKHSNNKPIKFVITGCKKKEVLRSKTELRNSIEVPNDKYVISYIGRHNLIKGYDRVVSLCDKLDESKFYFLCAGALSDTIPYPKKYNWKELGYINNSHEIMQLSDVIVIPNRNTYFDLVIIEALSQGKIVITSNTGGNIDISKMTRGLVLFDNNNETSLYNEIVNLHSYDALTLEKMSSENLIFYDRYCKLEKFAKNYLSAIEELLEEFRNV